MSRARARAVGTVCTFVPDRVTRGPRLRPLELFEFSVMRPFELLKGFRKGPKGLSSRQNNVK